MRYALQSVFCLGMALLFLNSCKRVTTYDLIINPRSDFEAALPITEQASEELVALLNGGADLDNALSAVAASLESHGEVDYCEQIGSALMIHYKSGTSQFVIVGPSEEPLPQQALLGGVTLSSESVRSAAQSDKTASSRKALVLTPFEGFLWFTKAEEVVQLLTTFGYSPEHIDVYSGNQVTVDLVCNLDFASYSFVYWNTHGAAGELLLTSETYESAGQRDSFWDLERAGLVTSGTVAQLRLGKWVIISEKYVAITADGLFKFIQTPFGQGSVFYADACESALDRGYDLESVLLYKELTCYIGWTDRVLTKVASHTAGKLLDRLFQGMNVADAFQKDPQDDWFLADPVSGYGAELVYLPPLAGSLVLVSSDSVAAPIFDPPAGSYTAAQSVTISCTTSGASIRYTTDGSAPTETHGTVYAGAITVSDSVTIKAIAYKDGWTDSEIASAIYAINPPQEAPGTLKWSFATGGPITTGPALGGDGTIYVGSQDGKLYAIDSAGTLKWSFGTGAPIYSTPAIADDGTIYVGSDDGNLYALNSNGSLKWSVSTSGPIRASPAVAVDGAIYVGARGQMIQLPNGYTEAGGPFYEGVFYAINADGTTKWQLNLPGSVESSAAIDAKGAIYVVVLSRLIYRDFFGSILVFQASELYKINWDSSILWTFFNPLSNRPEPNPSSAPAISQNGTVYVSAYNYLYAIVANGVLLWSFDSPETSLGAFSNPAIDASGVIYLRYHEGTVHAINATGNAKWSCSTSGDFGDKEAMVATPAIGANGTVYIGSADGNLNAIGIDGLRKWTFLTGGDLVSSPTVAPDGTIYVGSSDGKLYAIYDSSGGLANAPWPMFHRDVRHTGRQP